jgi:hypothetical protein
MTNYVHITTACGVDKTVADQATDWILDRHAHAHNKGIDGLSAGGCETQIEPASAEVARVLDAERIENTGREGQRMAAIAGRYLKADLRLQREAQRAGRADMELEAG